MLQNINIMHKLLDVLKHVNMEDYMHVIKKFICWILYNNLKGTHAWPSFYVSDLLYVQATPGARHMTLGHRTMLGHCPVTPSPHSTTFALPRRGIDQVLVYIYYSVFIHVFGCLLWEMDNTDSGYRVHVKAKNLNEIMTWRHWQASQADNWQWIAHRWWGLSSCQLCTQLIWTCNGSIWPLRVRCQIFWNPTSHFWLST